MRAKTYRALSARVSIECVDVFVVENLVGENLKLVSDKVVDMPSLNRQTLDFRA